MNERPIRPHPKPAPRATGTKTAFAAPRPVRLSADSATEIAIEALGWLAADPERLDRFLALTGIDHGSIRKAAAQPGFLAAVLDHLCGDEATLLAFSSDAGKTPETIAAAREILAGPSMWTSI